MENWGMLLWSTQVDFRGKLLFIWREMKSASSLQEQTDQFWIRLWFVVWICRRIPDVVLQCWCSSRREIFVSHSNWSVWFSFYELCVQKFEAKLCLLPPGSQLQCLFPPCVTHRHTVCFCAAALLPLEPFVLLKTDISLKMLQPSVILLQCNLNQGLMFPPTNKHFLLKNPCSFRHI